MNWTTAEPISGVKYIVETNTGSIFPAHVINGTWWNYDSPALKAHSFRGGMKTQTDASRH